MTGLNEFEKRLLDEFQRHFPLTPRPYAEIAGALGTDEDSVLDALGRLQGAGSVSRVGAVVTPHRAGSSTLAAIAVPPDRLNMVADLVSALPEVNHNYEREYDINLWFVVTAADRERVAEVIRDIETRTGLTVLDLPLLESYCIDLGFPLTWN